MSYCPICCDTINRSTKSEVICRFDDCKYMACKECVRTYLTHTTLEPHCMKCRKKWDLEFLKTNLNASFMQTDYKDHRKSILIDSAISKLSEHYSNAVIYNNQKKSEIEISEKMAKIDEHHHEITKIYREIAGIRNNPDLVLKKEKDERRKFVMPCQTNDCRGMLSSSYKCELCEKFTCAQCFEAIVGDKEDHTCKKEDVDTADELRRNSKPCPRCGTRISKIDGCDQMWCVECKTAFSWNRGTIETGNVHNPHFFQWMRQTGGQIGEPNILCGRDNNRAAIILIKDISTTLNRVSSIFSSFLYNYKKSTLSTKPQQCEDEKLYLALKTRDVSFYSNISEAEDYFFKYYRFINHVDNVDLRNIRRVIQHRDDDNILFYKYILNECEKDELADFLIKRDSSNVKDNALRDILEAFVMAGRQIIEEYHKELLALVTIDFKEEVNQTWDNIPTHNKTLEFDVPKSQMPAFIKTVQSFYKKNYEYYHKLEKSIPELIKKYYKIVENFTVYTNIEMMRYYILYSIRRQVSLWNHSIGEEEWLKFDSKADIVSKLNEYTQIIDRIKKEQIEKSNEEPIVKSNEEPVINSWV